MRYVILIIALVFLLLFPVHSFSSSESNDYFKLYGGIWSIDSGAASFRTSFPISGLGTGFSELEWDQLDSFAPMIGLKVNPFTYLLAFDFQYVGGDLRHGENTDTDWVGGYVPDPILKSKADTDGDVEYWSIDLDFLIYPFRTKPQRTQFEAIIGYFRYDYNLRDTNGVLTADPFGMYGGTGPFPGLDSTFDFEWKGIKTGLSFEHDFIETPSKGLHGFGFKLAYSYLWNIEYEGEGYWNLRDLRFNQEADDGSGYDFLFYLFYNPLRNFQVQLGYRSMKVEAEGGLDLRDGVKNADLDQAVSSSKGFMLNLAYIF